MALNISVLEISGNVVVTASGSVNLTGLNYLDNSGGGASLVAPTNGVILYTITGTSRYSGATTTIPSLGPGTPTGPTSFSGDSFGFEGITGIIYVPQSYVSNTQINGSMTFNSSTLTSLGFSAGTYTMSWGSDSLTVQVGEPPISPTPTITSTVTPTNTITPTPTSTPQLTTIEITSVNYNGEIADISFTGCSGNIVNIGEQTIPYNYSAVEVYGEYELYFSGWNKTCLLSVPCPSPTPTNTNTPTATPTVTPTMTPTGTPTIPAGSPYYFFVSEGGNAVPPSASGNTEFFYTSGGPTTVTYNPNYTGGTFQLYFNRYSSDGTDNLTAMQGLDTTGGTITMVQGSNTVIYTGNSFAYTYTDGGAPNQWLNLQVTGSSQQTIVSGGMFVSGSPIYVSFGTPAPTPTPSATSVTPTPTPSSGASSSFNVTVLEVGPNVVWSGSGSFDLTNLTLASTLNATGGYGAASATWVVGPDNTSPTSSDVYSGITFTTYPTSFGTGGIGPTSFAGSLFGMVTISGPSSRQVLVPSGYVSGTNISGSMTFNSTTLSAMGLTPGTYTYSWGTGSLTLQIGT